MDRYMFLGVIITGILLIAACEPVPEEVPAEEQAPAEEPQEPAEQPAEIPVPEETVEETTEEPEEQPEQDTSLNPATIVDDLLSQARSKVKSYSFAEPGMIYYIAGGDIRVDIEDFVRLTLDVDGSRKVRYISSVFINPATKKALGYCDPKLELNIGSLKCTDQETVEVDFDEYYRKTPFEWLEEFKSRVPTDVNTKETLVKVGSGYKTSSPTLTFEETGKTTVMYIEKHSGLPYKIDVVKDGAKTTYLFRDIVINTVKEEYVKLS